MKLSVIVPVYNVASYVENCVKSILSNNVDMEVILVNDGSTDNSGEICDRIASENNNVVVIHKENGGLSSARNAGLDIAKGDYITFVDSDDYVSSTIYKKCLDIIAKENVQCLKFRNKAVHDFDYDFSDCKLTETLIFDNKQTLDWFFHLTDYCLSYSVCNMILSKDLISDIRFVEGVISEDIIFDYQIFLKFEKLVLIDLVGYAYYQRTGSISHSVYNENRACVYKVWEYIKTLNTDENRIMHIDLNILYFKFVNLCLMLKNKKSVPENTYKRIKRELFSEIKKNKKIIAAFKGMDFKRKVMLNLMCFNFELSGIAIRLLYRK